MYKYQNILEFWFEESKPDQWFKKDTEFDNKIKENFSNYIDKAILGNFLPWEDNKEGCLALIIILDQFTRNIFRGDPNSFLGDQKALRLSQKCVVNGYLEKSKMSWCQFMLVPMMHSEDLIIQEKSLPFFKKYTNDQVYDFAIKHRDIIFRFGRFPHRNKILFRKSTAEELEFLNKPGSSF